MQRIRLPRRLVFVLTMGVLVLFGFLGLSTCRYKARSMANVEELKLPDSARGERFDFDEKGIEGWTTINGRWTVEKIPDAPNGKRAIVQRAVENAFNVIIAPGGPYTDVDVSVRFKPI